MIISDEDERTVAKIAIRERVDNPDNTRIYNVLPTLHRTDCQLTCQSKACLKLAGVEQEHVPRTFDSPQGKELAIGTRLSFVDPRCVAAENRRTFLMACIEGYEGVIVFDMGGKLRIWKQSVNSEQPRAHD